MGSPFDKGQRCDKASRDFVRGDAADEDAAPLTEEMHLHSAKELEGYAVESLEGEMGHVDEVLITPAEWRIAYLVLRTNNWLPGKRVIIPTQTFRPVDWVNRSITVMLPRDEISEAPKFVTSRIEDGTLKEDLRHYFAVHQHA